MTREIQVAIYKIQVKKSRELVSCVPSTVSGWVQRKVRKSSASTSYPPAIAGGTDCFQVRFLTFEAKPGARNQSERYLRKLKALLRKIIAPERVSWFSQDKLQPTPKEIRKCLAPDGTSTNKVA